MKGYYGNEAATAAVLRDGWFRTGDRGRVDKEGYLFITGRSKEVIVLSSGKNIYPEDVEKLYLGPPLIKEICILGTESEGRLKPCMPLSCLIRIRKAGRDNQYP